MLALLGAIAYAFYQHLTAIAITLAVATFSALMLVYIALLEQSPNTIKPKSKENGDDKNKQCETLEQNLKDIQQQLVIQEKLASVGMLTAGIAHEIKNPLNFINNFADMTVELLDELKEELEKPLENAPEETKQAVNSTIDDIVINCKKINEHGKRAESIIKNMLIQARTSDVEKAPLDINALLEEYLNLAYHGMRAQNNKLNVKIEKNIDKSILPVMVDQQSIGRVFLNIINNGLYAANDKAEKISGNFMPTITINSEQDENSVIIKIKDNGNGIPEHVRAKIFEPFFTTKPAGQGTGLGLSICYDIVVSQHGGSLDVVSSPGEYTEFIIKLPKNVSSEKK